MSKLTLQNLGPAIASRRDKRGLREVADEIGISPATLSRVERGRLPDLDTFSKICRWLKIDAGEVLGMDKIGSQSEAQPVAVVGHLRADKNLSPAASKALANLILAAQQMA